MALPLFLVDAFSAVPFGGNPAAVVVLGPGAAHLPDDVRQRIAAEMNQAETAFVEALPHEEEGGGPLETASRFGLRWFTPTTEVKLCGHATLASAAVLFTAFGNTSASLRFDTRLSGQLSVRKRGKDQLEMRLPISYADSAALPPPLDVPGSPGAIALVKACVGDLNVAEVAFNPSLSYVVLKLEPGTTRKELEAIVPDSAAMLAHAKMHNITAVTVTCGRPPDDDAHDYLCRFFTPWMGIPEDAVTGSAHAVLGPFWYKRLPAIAQPQLTKEGAPPPTTLRARQCSPRGGELGVAVYECQGHVLVTGSAVITVQGQLNTSASTQTV